VLRSGNFPETRHSLLGAIRGDEDEGWQSFYRQYAPAVFRVARMRGLDAHDAEDIVQQVMIETARHIGSFEYREGRGRFRGWVRTITENKIVDAFRRARQPMAGDAALAGCAAETCDPQMQWEQEWKLQDVLWCLGQVAMDISPRRMAAFRMYSIEGRPAAEVAEALSMSVGYVYVTRCQVLGMLRERMQELDGEG
jgi:RNA polymerase sigma factor (sigma-70 family)